MIIITGPQDTDDAVGFLAEMAGLFDAVPSYSASLQWAAATVLYCLAGWERCSGAVADVQIAEACGLVVRYLSV